jgi:hypothetical protein
MSKRARAPIAALTSNSASPSRGRKIWALTCTVETPVAWNGLACARRRSEELSLSLSLSYLSPPRLLFIPELSSGLFALIVKSLSFFYRQHIFFSSISWFKKVFQCSQIPDWIDRKEQCAWSSTIIIIVNIVQDYKWLQQQMTREFVLSPISPKSRYVWKN